MSPLSMTALTLSVWRRTRALLGAGFCARRPRMACHPSFSTLKEVWYTREARGFVYSAV